MRIEKIKPIPKYMVEKIKKIDKERNPQQNGSTRYYSYLTTNDKELVKVTVAVKTKYKKLYCKQCAVHGVHSKECFVKDMIFGYMCGYQTGWHSEGLTRYRKWYEYNVWYCADDSMFDPYSILINKEYIDKFPEYKYSAYQQYDGWDILQYLRLYEEYPQTEFLVKAGLSKLTNSKQILKLIGKDKAFRKWLSKNRGELSLHHFYISAILGAYKTKKPLNEVQCFEMAKKELTKERGYKPIRDLIGGDYKRYLTYIGKQQISNRIYLDYLNACNYLGLDMNEEKNKYPHNFQYWHDIRADEYATAKALKDEEERKELYSKFKLTSKKYSALQYNKRGDYIVVIPKSPADLIYEGEKLSHCVGRMGYDQKFIREETLIFFIRTRENPKEPFVTVEYSLEKKKILQCYAYENTQPENTVMEYVNKVWLPYANRKTKQIVA